MFTRPGNPSHGCKIPPVGAIPGLQQIAAAFMNPDFQAEMLPRGPQDVISGAGSGGLGWLVDYDRLISWDIMNLLNT